MPDGVKPHCSGIEMQKTRHALEAQRVCPKRHQCLTTHFNTPSFPASAYLLQFPLQCAHPIFGRKINAHLPDCGSDFTRRIARSWWMRVLFRKSQHIHCSRCDQRSLVRGPAPAAGERPLKRRSAPARRDT
jgi:hypothetical protein